MINQDKSNQENYNRQQNLGNPYSQKNDIGIRGMIINEIIDTSKGLPSSNIASPNINYPPYPAPPNIKQSASTSTDKNNINSTTVILIIFPYGGYTMNTDKGKELGDNFWELIERCQIYSKYKPIVVINRDTINDNKALSFFAENEERNNNSISFFKEKEGYIENNNMVDTIKVSSVDTCQMWLHGWGEIIDHNDDLQPHRRIKRIIQVPGDIKRITKKEDFYENLGKFCSAESCTINYKDKDSRRQSCYHIVLGDFETEKFVGKSLIDSYGTFPLLANWFPKISKAIFALPLYKPRTEFLNIQVDTLKELLKKRPFAYEQTLNMLINSWDDKPDEPWKYEIKPFKLGEIVDYSDYRDYQECLNQIERTERMLKYLWREANTPKDNENYQEFKKFMDDYDFLCQRSQAICETARITIRALLGLGS